MAIPGCQGLHGPKAGGTVFAIDFESVSILHDKRFFQFLPAKPFIIIESKVLLQLHTLLQMLILISCTNLCAYHFFRITPPHYVQDIILSGMSPLVFYARAGSRILLGQMSGPTSVAFITPYSTNQPPGTVPVEYSLNGQDFLNTGYNLTYDQAIPTMDIETASIPTPIIYFVTPATVLAGVSVRISVVGENFQFTSTCVLGESLIPISTVFVSSTEVKSPYINFLHYYRISR